MIDECEARERILAMVPAPRPVMFPLGAAVGRHLLSPLRAVLPLPLFDNSAMDGYAVRSLDARAGRILAVGGEQPAGRTLGLTVEEGSSIRIFTGAPIPAGTDAVIPQEDVTPGPNGKTIRVEQAVEPGDFIRRRGADLCLGQGIAAAGERVSPALVGLIASQGWTEIECGASPRVTVVTTGDELIPPGVRQSALPDGCLFESNGVMLEALLRSVGVDHVTRVHVPDDLQSTERVLVNAAEESDLVLVLGGVSVGRHDHVTEAMRAAGFETAFWRVRIKPGKPMVFGRHRRQEGCLLFGLPGNPVSAFVTFVVFVLPAIRRWMGATIEDSRSPLRQIACPSGAALTNHGDRPHYVRGRIDPATGRFLPIGLQQSHALFGLSRADALARLDAGAAIAEGDVLDARLLP